MKPTAFQHPDALKAAALRRHKALATGLFLLMMLVYIFCIFLLRSGNAGWIGYVKAFAEAAMVGALADWFAVTALFHHPLGIPIPHTNLIEKSKAKIGDNLGGFVVSNFLSTGTIRPYIEKMKVSAYVATWLKNEKNIQLITNELAWLIKDIFQRMDEKSVTKFVSLKSKELLNDIDLSDALGAGMHLIIKRGDHERILIYLVEKIRHYVAENEDAVRRRVKEESHFLIPGFVDNIIATRLTRGVTRYLSEIESDPNHKIRQDFNLQLLAFTEKIKDHPAWQEELRQIKEALLSGDKIQQYASLVWKSLQSGISQDIDAERSATKLYVKKTIRDIAAQLMDDASLRDKIDGWIRHNLYKFILKNKARAGELISNTVGNWEGKELSNKLELEVGKDLQFIRINGTLVGGLVGLIIYTVTKMLA